MPVPSLLSTIAPLFAKLPDPSVNLCSQIHVHACAVCIQESWLNSHVADALISIQDFALYRLDRQYSATKTGGGVITHHFPRLSKPELNCPYSFDGTVYLAIHCHPDFSRHRSTIAPNLCVTPFYTQSDISSFLDSFLPFLVPLLDDNLHMIVGDFDRLSTLLLTTFDANDFTVTPTRDNSTLDRIITKHPELFYLELRAVISTSGHSLLLLKPKTYSQSFKKFNQIKIRRRNSSRGNILFLQRSLFRANFRFSFEFLNSDVRFLYIGQI